MATASAVFVPPPPQFERSISLNDLDSALHVREQVERDLVVPEDAEHRFLRATPQFSFVLPSFRQFDDDFRKFLYSSLVDLGIFKELENAKILNWCSAVHLMVPLLTLGDGNCLMHAASLAMWGVNDRYHILRRSVYQSLLEDSQGVYHRRWQHEQEQMKQRFLGGYELTEEQWKDEWKQIVDLVSPEEFPLGRSGAQFGNLEEIHIFVLANVLRRTIILLSGDTLRGTYGESFSPVNFCGIYLPLNWDPLDCVKNPLVIGYAQGHFTAIVSLEDGMLDLGNHTFVDADNTTIKHAIPLMKLNGSSLPVHFLLANEEGQASGLLRQYLDCAKIPGGQGVANQSDAVLIAKLTFTPPTPGMEKLVEGYFQQARDVYKHKMAQKQTQTQIPPPPSKDRSAKPCQTAGCPFFGCSESADLCSTCLSRYLSSLALQEPASGPIVPAFQQRHQSVPNQQLSGQPVVTKAPAVAIQSHPVHHQRAVGASSICHTSGCKYAATAGKGGLCLRCYEAERSAEETAASVEYQSVNREPCKVNGCDFFGSPEQHNLCSRCFRHFCVRLEETLEQRMPGSASMVVQPTAPPANPCQGTNCHSDGLPVLYDMCLDCYTACIRDFINSDGKTVGSTVAPPPEAPSHQAAKPVVCKKGILCVSPGCFNERIPQLNDLCSQCYQPAKHPSPAAMTASHRNIQSSTGLEPALLQNTAQGIYCSNGRCVEPVGSNTGDLCPACYSAQVPAPSSETNAPHGPKSPGLPAVTSPTLTTPTAPYMSHNSHIGHISSVYQVPSTQPGISTPGTHLAQHASWRRMQSQIKSIQTRITKCATPNCTFAGSPGKNFLCSQCFEKNVAEWKRMGRGYVTPSAGQPERNTARKCIIEGCSNQYGLDQNQLCGPCFQAALRRETQWVSQHQQGQGRSQMISTEPSASGHIPHQRKSHFSATADPCKTVGCLRFGSAEKNGLCKVCFDQMRQQAGEPRMIHPPASEAPRSPPAGATAPQHQPVSLSRPQIHSNAGPIQVASGSVMLSPRAVGGQRCCQPKCTMFGTSEMGGLCSQCFADKTIASSYPHSVPDAPLSSMLSSTSTSASEVSSVNMRCIGVQRECINAACKNMADPLLHNHCTKCFRNLYPELAQREEYRVCLEGTNLH